MKHFTNNICECINFNADLSCNICPTGSFLDGTTCVCTNPFVFDSLSNLCICGVDHFIINNICTPCNAHSRKNMDDATCICTNLSLIFNDQTNMCECVQNEINIDNNCVSCPINSSRLVNQSHCVCNNEFELLSELYF